MCYPACKRDAISVVPGDGPFPVHRGSGFSLIELMIVVAIIAILAAIAYPSYTSHITKTHRVAAEACLSEVANYMERYYTTTLSYKGATMPALDCRSAQQTGANYSYAFSPAAPSSSAYTAQATPINAQLTRDTKCGTLSLDQSGTRSASTGDVTCW
ncbi:type IV pilin protein [Rhodanobacter sp. 115]|uniref:type IV pilin protein n=1 Tax=Rhodanobacter sp. FW021-MT20 TaxID=1162282 RepID=UPI0034E42AE7